MLKFQSYKTDSLVSPKASLAKYQRSKLIKNQYELLQTIINEKDKQILELEKIIYENNKK